MASKLIEMDLKPQFMNLDSDLRDVPPSESTYNIGMEALVIQGSLVKVIGNTIINFALPAGTNQVIGFGEDITNQRGIHLIWNSNSQHTIVAYNLQSNSCQLVLQSPVLNFQLSNKIRKVEITQSENGSLMFWTDGYDNTSASSFNDTDFNSGRELNIDMAITFSANNIVFTDNEFNNGTVTFIGIADTTGYNIGDNIYVQQYSGYVNASYNGMATITGITPTTISTNIPWALNTPPNGGTIIKLPTTGYKGITLQTIQRIKYPPTIEPTAVYSTDSSFVKNLFVNTSRLCQFAYCWQYYDNSLSTYSPLSALAVPYGDESVDGTTSTELALINNVINLTFDTGSSLVKQITLGVRFSNIGEFGTFITLDKNALNIPDNVPNYQYSFYNDRQITILDQADWIRLYDSSPQVENTLDLIETDTGDNLVVAQCTESFDNITINITLQGNPIDVSGSLSPPIAPVVYTFMVSNIVHINMQIPNVLIEGSVFVYIDRNENNATYSHVITSQEAATPQLFLNEFISWLTALYAPFPNIHVSVVMVTTPTIPIGQMPSTAQSLNIFYNIVKFPTFKSGAKHLLGIEYGRDEGWEGAVQTYNKSTQTGLNVIGSEINIPFVTQIDTSYPTWIMQPQWQIITQIFHQPPIWATKYRWVYAGNNTVASFLQFSAVQPDFSDPSQTKILLTPLVDYGVQATPTSPATGTNPQSILTYNFTPGDRCRIISQTNSSTGNVTLINTFYDVQVLSYDAIGNILSVQALPSDIFTSEKNFLIELYTPSEQTTNPIYYELSPTFLIGNPHKDNRYHIGVTQNQDPNNISTVPAITTLSNGDTWLKTRVMNDTFNLVEDYNFSDFYISNSYNKGRPNVIDPYAKRLSLPICRHSQIYIYDTQINGLSSFWDGQGFTTPLSPKNGIITGLELVGYEMEVFQSQKVTSVLIQRLQMENTDGSSNQTTVSGSVAFFGSHTPRSDRYGTIYPESVCGDKTHRYCFDVINGGFIRVATDRNWNLSEYYLINNWTLALCNAMKNAGTENFNVYGYYDMGYDKVYWTIVYNVPEFIESIINVGGIPIVELLPNPDYKFVPFVINGITYATPITIVFCENGAKESKGFQGFMPFHGEFYGGIGNVMFSFKNGNIYKHWDGAIPNSFYGGASVSPNDNAPVAVAVIGNKQPEDVKTWYLIEEYCNSIMACPNDNDIFTLPNITYPQGMSSRLLPNKFSAQEGVISANFQKDLNTPNTPNAPILNGRDLKGECISVMLSNPDNNPLVLSKVIISAFVSAPTP